MEQGNSSLEVNMDNAVLSSVNKLHKSIVDSWKVISLEFKKYCDTVKLGHEQAELLTSHKTTLANISEAEIEDTELYALDPEIKEKLQCTIDREILATETSIGDILTDSEINLKSILVQIEKVFNVYKSSNLRTEDMARGSVNTVPLAEMLAALDNFRSSLCSSHLGRRDGFESIPLKDEFEKIPLPWNVSEIVSLKEEMDRILAME